MFYFIIYILFYYFYFISCLWEMNSENFFELKFAALYLIRVVWMFNKSPGIEGYTCRAPDRSSWIILDTTFVAEFILKIYHVIVGLTPKGGEASDIRDHLNPHSIWWHKKDIRFLGQRHLHSLACMIRLSKCLFVNNRSNWKIS